MDFGSYTCKAMRKSDGAVATNTIEFKRDRDLASGYTFELKHQIDIVAPIVAPIIERPQVEEEESEEKESEEKVETDKESAVIGNINNDRTIKILEEFQTYTHEGNF